MHGAVSALLIAGVLAAILVFGLFQHAPMPVLFAFGQRVDDLLMHTLAFAALAVVVSLWRPLTPSMLTVLVAACLALEIAQAFVPTRTASLTDFGAGCFGIGLGTALSAMLARIFPMARP